MEVIPRRPIFKIRVHGWSPYATKRSARTAAMTCPRCGRAFSLEDHTIHPDGRVTPSVVCPWKPCPYHAHLRLDGWA